VQIHKIQNIVQVMFRPIIRTDKNYVGCKYNKIHYFKWNNPCIIRLRSAVCQVSKHVLLPLEYVKIVAHIQYSPVSIRL